MPQSNEQGVVSCSGDGAVLYTNLSAPTTNPDHLHLFNCHNNTTYEVLTLPFEPSTFLSCGEDSTVRLFDLRQSSRCQKSNCRDNILIQGPTAFTAMCLSASVGHHVAVGSADSQVRIYDRRCLRTVTPKGYSLPIKCFSIPSTEKRPFRVTSLSYNTTGDQLLVNYSSDHLYLFDATAQGLDVAKTFSVSFKEQPDEESPLPPEEGSSSSAASPSTSGSQRSTPATRRTPGGSSSDSGWLRPRRLRLRGDWSDTGPDARPEGDTSNAGASGQARPILQAPIMNHMTEMLSRMLADPRTRANLHLLNRLGREAAGSTLEMPGDGEMPSGVAEGIEEAAVAVAREGELQDAERRSDAGDDADAVPGTSVQDLQEEEDNGTTAAGEQGSSEPDPKPQWDYLMQKFMGHRNARTMIKEASFWGNDYIMSGSDCGHVFTWEKATGKLVMLMEADQHVVNCIQPHPTLPYLATSGIDYDVKVWAPNFGEDDVDADRVRFDVDRARQLMERNAVMLEETKDTITVPASVMIRMLACIHTFRNRRTLNDFARINRS